VSELELGTAALTEMIQLSVFHSTVAGYTLQQLWGAVSPLQVIGFTVLFNLQQPENIKVAFKTLLMLVAFDVFQAQLLFDEMFDFEETPSFNQNFDDSGYGGSNFIEGLGSLYIIFVYTVILLLSILSTRLIFPKLLQKTKGGRWVLNKAMKVYVSVMSITFVEQAFMEFALCGTISVYTIFKDPDLMMSNSSMVFSSINAVICLISVILLPFVLLWISVVYFRGQRNANVRAVY
jgi:hypothetical protein